MRKIGMVAGGAALLALAFGGCSKSVSKDDVVNELVNQGMKREGAQCVVDKATAKGLDLNKIAHEDQWTGGDERIVGDATAECMLEGKSPI